MDSKQRVAAQTKIRHALLRNGYTPLANANKACYLPGWSSLAVTGELVNEWSTQLRYLTTGIRIDPPLVAIDVDIDDVKIVSDLWEKCCEAFGYEWEKGVLIRHGGGVKETWLCRVREPFHTPPGPKFVRPDEDVEDREIDRHKVELFGGASGRQIGAFGIHTPGERLTDPPIREYGWEGKNPAEVPLEELPELTREQCFRIVTWATELLEAAGWNRDRVYRPEDYEGSTTFYDLTDDMYFVVDKSGTRVSYDALGSYHECRMQEITGEGTNPTRGRVYSDDEGRAWVWDSETHARHLHEALREPDTANLFSALGSKLKAVMGHKRLEERVEETHRTLTLAEMAEAYDWPSWSIDKGADGEGWDRMDKMVDNLCIRYAYHAPGTSNEEVIDLSDGASYSFRKFQMLYANRIMKLETGEYYQKGGEDDLDRPKMKAFNPADLWARREDRISLMAFDFNPVDTRRLIPIGPNRYSLNLYEPPTFFEPPGDPSFFFDLLDHLLPDEVEREWFLNWCAYKVQNPGERGQAVIFVTPTFGTGRGTLFRILAEIIGTRWVSRPSASDMMGVGSQAHWDDWKQNCLLALADEVAAEASDYRTKKLAYEHLKDGIDPAPKVVMLNLKGKDRRRAKLLYSTLLATNHFDAMPLPPEDRRFTVLECTRVKLEDTRLLNAMYEEESAFGVFKESFIHGVWHILMQLPVVRDDFYRVLPTTARDVMIEANESIIEETLRKVLDRHEYPCILEADAARAVESMLSHQPRAKEQARRAVKQLLMAGFHGWSMCARKTFRVAVLPDGQNGYILATSGLHDGYQGEIKVIRGVAERDDCPKNVSPVERARWLGLWEEQKGAKAAAGSHKVAKK